MKKLAVIAIAALAALSACTKVEVDPRPAEKVTFAVGSYASGTKAASLIDVDGIDSFTCLGFLYGDNGDGTTTPQTFFGTSGETISYNSTTHEWLPSHTYYWPKSSQSYVNFVSWYDKNGAPNTVSEISFQITNRTIVADDAILIADEAWRYQANTTTYGFNSVADGVPTLFRHLLCRVGIKIHATTTVDPDNANDTYEVSVQSASFTGMRNRGSVSLVNSDLGSCGTKRWNCANAADVTLYWAPDVTSTEVCPLISSNTAISTSDYVLLEERSFMPQVLSDNVVLNLTYTVTAKTNGVMTSTETVNASVRMKDITNSTGTPIVQWLPNTKYNYTLAINPITQEIRLNPVVATEWSSGIVLSAVVE